MAEYERIPNCVRRGPSQHSEEASNSGEIVVNDKTSEKKCVTSEHETCPLCLNVINIYSVGSCDHIVCAECSIRLRVLCQQNECAICRKDLHTVYLVTSSMSFEEAYVLLRESPIKHRDFSIVCETAAVESWMNCMLSFICILCTKNWKVRILQREPISKFTIFKSYSCLRKHLRQAHEQFLCDLCIDNLKIFPHEHNVYNRSELVRHRRFGNPEDTSYKPHPKCQFCSSIRFFDDEALYLHLRKEHYWCHFCEASGVNQYYTDYTRLQDHFRTHHFLCEKGECRNEKFTSVFMSEIDLKAHRVSAHVGEFSKADLKQNRLVDVDLQFVSRRRCNNYSMGQNFYCGQFEDNRPSNPFEMTTVNSQRSEDFPSLNASSLSSVPKPNVVATESDFPNLTASPLSSVPKLNDVVTESDFPSLTASSLSSVPKPNVVATESDFPSLTASPLYSVPKPNVVTKNFSSLPSKPSSSVIVKGTQSAIHVTNPVCNIQDFPALSSSTGASLNTSKSVWSKKLSKTNRALQTNVDATVGVAPMSSNGVSNGMIKMEKVPVSSSIEYPALVHEASPIFKKKKERKKEKGMVEIRSQAEKRDNFSTNRGGIKNAALLIDHGSNLLSNHVYVQPLNFAQRNSKLMSSLMCLEGFKRGYTEFREMSRRFRKGDLSSTQYYNRCFEIIGGAEDGTKFQSLLSEIIVLLPNIKLQKELWLIHSKHSNYIHELASCPVCEQILHRSDIKEHQASHSMDSDFPSLS